MRIPVLEKLGKRKSWALLSQFGLLISIVGIACFGPNDGILWMALFAFFISFFSATQDIVLDAFRVEMFAGSNKGEVEGATFMFWDIGSVA